MKVCNTGGEDDSKGPGGDRHSMLITRIHILILIPTYLNYVEGCHQMRKAIPVRAILQLLSRISGTWLVILTSDGV